MEYHLTLRGGGMDNLFQKEWFGKYWLELFLTNKFYLALLVAVIVLSVLIMRVRKR